MTESTSPPPGWCERCGRQYDDGCSVTVSCGLETPALKNLRANCAAAEERLNQIAISAFGEAEIARICGLDWLVWDVWKNVSLVFIYVARETWPPGAQAAWDARKAAMEAFEACTAHDPDAPTRSAARTRQGAKGKGGTRGSLRAGRRGRWTTFLPITR